MLKNGGFTEVFFFFFFLIEFSRSNVIKNNFMVTSEAMLVQVETLLLQSGISQMKHLNSKESDSCSQQDGVQTEEMNLHFTLNYSVLSK